MKEYQDIHTEITELHEDSHLEKGGDSALLEINGTIFFMAVSFIIFVVLMQKVFYAPLSRIRQKRAEHMENIKAGAERAVASAEKLSSEYTSKINQARKKAHENTAKSMAEANEERARILDEKKQDVAEFLNINRTQIQEEKQKTIENLKENIDSYASDIFKKLFEDETAIKVGKLNE